MKKLISGGWDISFNDDTQYDFWKNRYSHLRHTILKDVATGRIYIKLLKKADTSLLEK